MEAGGAVSDSGTMWRCEETQMQITWPRATQAPRSTFHLLKLQHGASEWPVHGRRLGQEHPLADGHARVEPGAADVVVVPRGGRRGAYSRGRQL